MKTEFTHLFIKSYRNQWRQLQSASIHAVKSWSLNGALEVTRQAALLIDLTQAEDASASTCAITDLKIEKRVIKTSGR